ncbi:spore coat protein U domain-containing protein, partial [Enterobacter hormaechei]|uniref:spore coat protein U domain-containing protein n=1 Tax=Enterobacter hormaechei TaxID=158836 RepID=UPI0029D68B03
MAQVLDKRLILSCCALSIISLANAATLNGTFQELMTIQKACTVTAGSASNISLGPVNTTATNTSASNTISINCSKTTPYF